MGGGCRGRLLGRRSGVEQRQGGGHDATRRTQSVPSGRSSTCHGTGSRFSVGPPAASGGVLLRSRQLRTAGPRTGTGPPPGRRLGGPPGRRPGGASRTRARRGSLLGVYVCNGLAQFVPPGCTADVVRLHTSSGSGVQSGCTVSTVWLHTSPSLPACCSAGSTAR